MDDEFDQVNPKYERLVVHDGVRTITGNHRFEIVIIPGNDIWEQQAVQMLREWIRWRRKKDELRNTRDLPE